MSDEQLDSTASQPDGRLGELFDRFLEDPSIGAEQLALQHPALVEPLKELIDRHRRVQAELAELLGEKGPQSTELPTFTGFRTLERLGNGGAGEVYKVEHRGLQTMFAIKVIRPDTWLADEIALQVEAIVNAQLKHESIVQVVDFQPSQHGQPAFIQMEYVAGTHFGSAGAELEYKVYAKQLERICDAMAHAHDKGIQHRDLKPKNVIVTGTLVPKIVDFGLGGSNPQRGHFVGTLAYMAPEQLDAKAAIDERCDIYALGVMLYEVLAGRLPYVGRDEAETVQLIQQGAPAFPRELCTGIPPDLERIALKAMETDPGLRYQSMREMAGELKSYRAGNPVQAKPSIYGRTLRVRVADHLRGIEGWLEADLIHSDEHNQLRAAYSRLELPDDDWIVQSRVLTYSLIWLYLGAFLLTAGSLFYFVARRGYVTDGGWAQPVLVLAVPFVILNLAGRYLYDQGRKAVGVAFLLAAVCLLPLFLLILFHETKWLEAADDPLQIFKGSVSNRQLQVTILIAGLWAGGLAVATETAAMSTLFAVLTFLLTLAVLGDFGFRGWLLDGRYHLLAAHLMPLAAIFGALGKSAEAFRRVRLAPPLYLGVALVLMFALDLAALEGKMFLWLGISLEGLQPAHISAAERSRIYTLAALSLNGLTFYVLAAKIGRLMAVTPAMVPAQWLLFAIAPFSTLVPLGELCRRGVYSSNFNWLYLFAALAFALLSYARQRRSFYYAGLTNSASALLVIATREKWYQEPFWGIVVVLCGAAGLAVGYRLDTLQHKRKQRNEE